MVTAHGCYREMPQVPPVLHDEAGLELNESELPPESREANVEIFFLTSGLPQCGQTTSLVALALRTSSSKDFWQVGQVNSKSGMLIS